MRRMHIVLVCHTELDFEGSWALFERIQPQIDEMLVRVADATGRKPKMTYCLTDEFLSERLDDAFRFVEEQHEIGIHSHLPGAQRAPRHSYQGHYAYQLDESGVLNQDLVAGALRQIAIALGLPSPHSHVSGMFTFQRTTVQVLQEAGFTVDCSLLPGEKGTHKSTGDFILFDKRRHRDPRPYRPALEHPWMHGDSEIIELPVSGNLGGGDIGGQIQRLRERLDGPHEVDVFQSFWHHFEFADLGWTQGTVRDAEKFLLECARQQKVVFSTASEAAEDFKPKG